MEIVKPDLSHTCRTCPHWHFAMQTKEGKGGECRLNPPTLHMLPVETLQGVGMSLRSQFPTIMESAWCGDHPARKSAVHTAHVLSVLKSMDNITVTSLRALVTSILP